jgi:type IV pilus assembly protein PilY1
MPTLLGGLVLFTSYQPFADTCLAEGVSYLYGVYYLTGTAWYENVFGTYDNSEGTSIVKDRLSLGVGMATTPSLHVGSGSKGVNAFVQTSTGTILEIEQENLPVYNFKSGSLNWRME